MLMKKLIVISGIFLIPAIQSYAGVITTPDVSITVTNTSGKCSASAVRPERSVLSPGLR